LNTEDILKNVGNQPR